MAVTVVVLDWLRVRVRVRVLGVGEEWSRVGDDSFRVLVGLKERDLGMGRKEGGEGR